MPNNPPAPANFYDRLAPFYHLIYPDWNASIARQGVSTDRLCELMVEAGFEQVRRIDEAFYQPVLW